MACATDSEVRCCEVMRIQSTQRGCLLSIPVMAVSLIPYRVQCLDGWIVRGIDGNLARSKFIRDQPGHLVVVRIIKHRAIVIKCINLVGPIRFLNDNGSVNTQATQLMDHVAKGIVCEIKGGHSVGRFQSCDPPRRRIVGKLALDPDNIRDAHQHIHPSHLIVLEGHCTTVRPFHVSDPESVCHIVVFELEHRSISHRDPIQPIIYP